MANKAVKQNRYNRNSTKRRLTIRPIKHPLRLCAIVLGILAVAVAAVVWGNVLYQKSENYRADLAAGRWTVETVTDADILPTVKDVPPAKGWPLSPDGSLHTFESDGYTDATLWLCQKDRTLPYHSDVATAAGMACADRSLADEISRIHESGLRAVGIFAVHTLTDTAAEDALTRYHIQTELSILTEYASVGLDEILLIGLPSDSEAASAILDYVTALRDCLSDAPTLVGVNLSLDTMTEALSGSTLPAELLTVCDYLTLDMTKPHTYELYAGAANDSQSDGTDEPAHTSYLSRLLYRYRYLYVRYNLRLLFTDEQIDHLGESAEHGFDRFLVIQTYDTP